jgi:hypothetical protein
MGEASRLAGVFIEPGKTFRDIAARPRWVAPLLLTVLAGLIYIYMFNHKIGWEHFMRQTLESSPRAAQLTAEQREQAIQMQLKFAPIGAFAGALLATPVYTIVASAILLFIFNAMMSAQLKFKQVFSVMCYAGLTGVVFSILGIVVMFLKNPEDFNLRNPLAFNPAAFLDPLQTPKFLYALLSSIDLFSFWAIALIAVGLSAAGQRLSFGKALVGVLIPWGVLVLSKAAMAGVF